VTAEFREEEAKAPPGALRRWLPAAAVVLAFSVAYVLGLQEFLSLEALRDYRQGLAGLVAERPFVAAGGYVLAYAGAVALSFPGASFLTIAGGFLFGCVAGTALAALAASIGATLIFLAARTALGDLMTRRAGPRLRRLCEGLARDGFNYLLFLRLVPLFPFWLVNLAAALFGIRLLPYVAATVIGILPATFVFAYFGDGLGSALEERGSPLSLRLFVALALLGALALLPVAVRRWRAAHGKRGSAGR
jgi:uncharacterized membrane protein YdjX (TVP38/TMEM64 family)